MKRRSWHISTITNRRTLQIPVDGLLHCFRRFSVETMRVTDVSKLTVTLSAILRINGRCWQGCHVDNTNASVASFIGWGKGALLKGSLPRWYALYTLCIATLSITRIMAHCVFTVSKWAKGFSRIQFAWLQIEHITTNRKKRICWHC